MNFTTKTSKFVVAIALSFFAFGTAAYSQDRPRVVRSVSSQPVNQPSTPASTTRTVISTPANTERPALTNEIVVQPKVPLVKKTASTAATAARSMYSAATTSTLLSAIKGRLGIPYLYGSTGPNRYDCSGFVWAVFNDAGIHFERQSARGLWAMSEPATEDEKTMFGTLVFMNRLGHMGIVADSEGFYHASSSKGITYSKFKGYWEKRIVGFRKLNIPSIDEIR